MSDPATRAALAASAMCGHEHRNVYQALACNTVQKLAQATGFSACVVIDNEDDQGPAISVIANASGMALMARRLCEMAMQLDRPTDCEACAPAHDRMSQALVILSGVSGRC